MALGTSEVSVVPKNYGELFSQYGDHIRNQLKRANRVERNYEDLVGYVNLRLIEAKLLDKFREKLDRMRPKVIDALAVCDILGVPWTTWLAAMSAYHTGAPIEGSCGVVIGYRVGHWMPTPINIAAFEAQGLPGHLEKNALFSFKDVLHLAELDGGLGFLGQDVQRGVPLAPCREVKIKIPEVKATRSMFKNYLAMAVGNHFSNFCRTEDRRHKERTVIPSPHAEDDAPSWEAGLTDSKVADSDTMVALAEAKAMLADILIQCSDGVDLCKPVEQHTGEVFEMLEGGESIMQALRKSDLPPKVCKSVLRTVRPLFPDFA